MQSPHTDVIEGMKPILLISKLFGLNAITHYPRTNKLVTTKIDYLWTAIAYLLLTFASIGAFVDCSTSFATTIMLITTLAQRFSTTLSTWLNIPIGFIHRKNVINLLDTIKEFDGIFLAVTPSSSFNACRKRSTRIFFILGCMNILELAPDIYYFMDGSSTSYCNIAYGVSYTLVFITEMLLIILLLELGNRFKALNIYLRRLLLSISPSGKLAVTIEHRLLINASVEEAVIFCSGIHSRLCDGANGLNRTFQLQVIIKIFRSFVLSVTSSHFMATVTISYSEEYIGDLIEVYFLNISAILINLAEVVGTIYAFTFVDRQCKKTARILFETPFKYSTPKLNNTITVFSNQIYFTKPKFTAFGLFPLDWTAIYTFCTAWFTFFIILIQLTGAEVEMAKSVTSSTPITTNSP